MEHGIYAIFDRKAEEFGPLVKLKNDAVAVRMFWHNMRDAVDVNDYELYWLGTFNDSTGEFAYGKRRVETERNVRQEIEDSMKLEGRKN